MNTYSPDNSAIIDATGKEWPVETAHPLPLPEGIELGQEDTLGYPTVLNGPDLCGRWNQYASIPATHWLARRPLPEVPKVKTQEEKDEEEFNSYYFACGGSPTRMSHYGTWKAAIAYARQCPAKPAA